MFSVFFFKQKTAYEMRISDWSSDVCSSDLLEHGALLYKREGARFNFIAFNIASDAIINYVAEALPDVDKSAGSIRYGVRRCQEFRAEERRVGKACVRTCRSRWSLYH